jgi:hypothetical protein
LPSLLTLTAVGAVAACNNTGASVGGLSGALAVGAYHSVRYGDGCSGGGKINFCTTEQVTEVLELSSSDPTTVEVLPGGSHPRPDMAKSPYYVLGRKAGESSLVFKGRFDDGTVRADSVVVEVKAATLGKVDFINCGVGQATSSTNVLTRLGEADDFELPIFAGTEQLVGWLPGAVTGEGVTDISGDGDGNLYTWQAPLVPGVQKLQPGTVPKVTGTLIAYGPEQVTAIDVASRDLGYPAAFLKPGDFYVDTRVRLNGEFTCDQFSVELHSSTPAICSGPAGETVWPGDEYGGKAAVHAEGTCTLGVSLAGGKVLTTKSFPMFFVTAKPAGLEIPGFGNHSQVEGGTACSYGYGSVGVCKGGRWVEKTYCTDAQTCDFVPDTTKGCLAGASCAICRGLR